MRADRGFTIVEIIVVLTFVAILAGMLFPALCMAGDRSRRGRSCGNSQRQIVLAMLVYANENDGLWPCRPSNAAGQAVAQPGSNKFTTIATFEFLAAQTGKEMPNKVFGCPSEAAFRPRQSIGTDLEYASGISRWCPDAASDPKANPGFVYDWSAPSTAGNMRVVVADRGRGSHGHKQIVMAGFGDGHVGNLKATLPSDPRATLDLDDSIGAPGAGNRDAAGDDIYSATGDGNDQMTPGYGSATRAWVR